jgi:hypothetical protein
VSLAVLGGIGALVYFKYYRPKRRQEERQAGEPVEDLPIPGQRNQALQESKADTQEEDNKERKSA